MIAFACGPPMNSINAFAAGLSFPFVSKTTSCWIGSCKLTGTSQRPPLPLIFGSMTWDKARKPNSALPDSMNPMV